MEREVPPDTHILQSLENKNITAAIAVAEFIDNSFATANEFRFIIHPDCIMAIDNGEGVSSMDDIFGLAWSKNKHDSKNIGLFGIGAKDAQLFFGTHCKVETVFQNVFYEGIIDWDKVKQNHKWVYNLEIRSVDKAREYIRNGGTIITVTNLKNRRYNFESLTKRLTQRFRPALLKGYKITIIDFRDSRTGMLAKAPRELILNESLSKIGLTGKLISVENLEVGGRKFSINYGILQEADDQLSGIHFAFGHAFPFSKRNLTAGRILIPLRLYAEVMLSEDWKNDFAPNKEKLVFFEQELEAVVLSILQPLIKELAVQSQDIRLKYVNLALATEFADAIGLDQGEHGKGERIKDEHPHNHGHASHKPQGEGSYNKEKRKQSCGGLKISRDDKLGEHRASNYAFGKGQLEIILNGSIPMIELAYLQPTSITDLWPIIAREFSLFCRDHVLELDNILPRFVENLDKEGYSIDPEYPNLVADKVFTFAMKQCPLLKEKRQAA